MKSTERSQLLEGFDHSFNDYNNNFESSLIASIISTKCQSTIQRNGASLVTATFLLVNTALGAGILNYPVAYDRLGGIGMATFVQVIMLAILASTMFILAYCADLTGVRSYHEVIEQMCGHTVRQLAALSILVSCFGICVTFLIIIGDQFDRIFATFFGDQFCYNWYSNRIFTIALTAVLAIWPLSYSKRIDFLKHANLLGVFATLYIIFLNVYEYYKLDVIPGPIKTHPDNILKAIAALPVVCFAYQSHEVVVPVYACLKERNIKNFMKITSLTLSILFIFYCVSGTYGYLTFGGTVAPDVTQMYNPLDPVVSTGIVALIIKMISGYLPVMFCGRDTFMGLFLKQPDQLLLDQTYDVKEFRNRVTITSGWNFTVLILSLVTPNLTIAIGFLGSLAACNVFIFPGLCMISLSRRILDREEREGKAETNKNYFPRILFLFGIFIIITGIFMFFIILFQVITDLSAEERHQALCINS